jgi:hypothetical protein
MDIEFAQFEPCWYEFYADFEDHVVLGEIEEDGYIKVKDAYYLIYEDEEYKVDKSEAVDVCRYHLDSIRDEFREYLYNRNHDTF